MRFRKHKMIDRKLILANAPKNMGEQIHINHTGCSSGEDKKQRLYIKRTDKGIVAYCHHCAEAGFAADNNDSRLSTWLTEAVSTDARKFTPPPKLVNISDEGKAWLHKYDCSTAYIGFSGVEDKPNQIALTLFDPDKKIIGFQVRNLLPRATPKYITTYLYNSFKGDATWFGFPSNRTLVITEDYLSAYRVYQERGASISSLALLRTTITDRTLLQIYELNFERVIIWLDPDEAGIKGAKKAQKELTHFLSTETSIKVFSFLKEPKEYTPDELKTILKGL